MGKIVVFGDSIAYGKWDEQGGWVARLRNYIDTQYNIGKGGNLQVYNLGIPGEVSVRMTKRVEQELKMRIDTADTKGNNLVIFTIGVNDANPANWMTLKKTLKEEYKKSLQQYNDIATKMNCKVAFIGLTPINEGRYAETSKFKGTFFLKDVTEYEEYFKEICAGLGVLYLSIYESLLNSNFPATIVDGILPNSEGHEMLFQKIKDFLNQNRLIEYCK